MTHPVQDAVLPQKTQAIENAAAVARKTIDKVLADLAAHGMDAEAAAPYPKSLGLSRAQYVQGRAKYQLYRTLTAPPASDFGRRPGAPEIRSRDLTREEHFIETTRRAAADQYDAFVAKLVRKIGDCVSATISGSHVWGYSNLRVTKADGSVEVWRTQQIVNVSSLGTIFNQWPSRKVKA